MKPASTLFELTPRAKRVARLVSESSHDILAVGITAEWGDVECSMGFSAMGVLGKNDLALYGAEGVEPGAVYWSSRP